MRVLEVVKTLNKKVTLKSDKLMELKKHYLGFYRIWMVKMYNEGYVSDPTKLDEKEIFSNIFDMGIKGMFTTSGCISCTTQQIKYAMSKHEEDEEIMSFLSMLYELIKYREYCLEVDNMYNYFNFEVEDKQKVCLNYKATGAMIQSACGFNVSRPSLTALISTEFEPAYVTINDFLWSLAMQILEIPQEDWEKDGLFDKDLSHTQEVESMELLLDGCVNLTGTYSELLTNWLLEHKWSDSKMFINSKGLYSYLFNSNTLDILEQQAEILQDLKNRNINILAILSNKIYYAKERSYMYLPMSCFSVVVEDEDIVMDNNPLNSVTSELYSHWYLTQEEVSYVGCPILVNVSWRREVMVYDIEQCSILSKTWFEDEDIVWSFRDKEDLGEIESPFDKGTLEDILYKGCIGVEYGNLVCKVENKYTPKEFIAAKKNVMKYLEKGK